MKIEEFIKNRFITLLNKRSCLVVYDENKIYKDTVLSLQNSETKVVNVSEGSILGRLEAMELWTSLGKESLKQLLIYLPISKPKEDETSSEKLQDPFTVFALGGSVFPESISDTYLSLCKRAKPEIVPEIEELFKNVSLPSFEQIDFLSTGKKYPVLQSLFQVEGSIEILVHFLIPTESHFLSLSTTSNWKNEMHQFCKDVLGISILWDHFDSSLNYLRKIILLSEFAFSLPAELPAELKNITILDRKYENLVYKVCERLRNDITKQEKYVAMAELTNKELELEKFYPEPGKRDTFSFEEKRFLSIFIELVKNNEYAKAQEIYLDKQHSLWINYYPERKNIWNTAKRSLELLQGIKDLQLETKKIPSALDIVKFYTNTFYKIDTEYRLADIGNKVDAPMGSWGYNKRRCLVGNGQTNESVLKFDPTFIGLNTNAKDFVVPKGFSTFRKGTMFFHEGLSLQECLVPLIRFDLEKQSNKHKKNVKLSLSYRGGKETTVTSRVPSIDIKLESEGLFQKDSVSFVLEAYSGNKKVGEVIPTYINPESKMIEMKFQSSQKVNLRIDEDFQGDFEVRAFDPITEIVYARLSLKLSTLD